MLYILHIVLYIVCKLKCTKLALNSSCYGVACLFIQHCILTSV